MLKKMTNFYDQIRRIFITPSIPSVFNEQPNDTDEQSESEESTGRRTRIKKD